MRIQHNVMAMNAYRNYSNNTSALAKNLERLSSGYKINRAGDDAAGLAISEKMRAQITGLEAAQKNVKDGISLVNTAEGAMQEIQDMLNRMVYLSTQSSNGTYDDAVDRKNLQQEVDQLRDEINRIADSANFNGIKLLDGSLETSGVGSSTSVTVDGNVRSYSSTGNPGIYQSSAPISKVNIPSNGGSGAGTMKNGDTYEVTVSMNDGTAYTVELTAKTDDVNKKAWLVTADGKEYELSGASKWNAAGEAKVDMADLDDIVVSELNKSDLATNYDVTSDGAGTLTFTAKQDGTNIPAVSTIDCASTVAATGDRFGAKAVGVNVTQAARDAGVEILASSITEYDGTNYDKAVFTINGHKFVLMTETMDGTTTGTKNSEYMRAVQALGSDVTVLVGGTAGLTNGDGNFNQNISKIAEVTGLNVVDAITETPTANAVAPGAGIRLTASKGTETGGLTLQIGDTSDSFNQLRVGVKDMHTTSLGIDKIDISTQTGAQAAVDVVKKAINTVSEVRGKLGAISNRLDHTANNLSVMKENITDAESAIRDTDIAEEMMSYTKNNILVQSAQAMLAQANQVPQGVLQLLQ